MDDTRAKNLPDTGILAKDRKTIYVDKPIVINGVNYQPDDVSGGPLLHLEDPAETFNNKLADIRAGRIISVPTRRVTFKLHGDVSTLAALYGCYAVWFTNYRRATFSTSVPVHAVEQIITVRYDDGYYVVAVKRARDASSNLVLLDRPFTPYSSDIFEALPEISTIINSDQLAHGIVVLRKEAIPHRGISTVATVVVILDDKNGQLDYTIINSGQLTLVPVSSDSDVDPPIVMTDALKTGMYIVDRICQ